MEKRVLLIRGFIALDATMYIGGGIYLKLNKNWFSVTVTHHEINIWSNFDANIFFNRVENYKNYIETAANEVYVIHLSKILLMG